MPFGDSWIRSKDVDLVYFLSLSRKLLVSMRQENVERARNLRVVWKEGYMVVGYLTIPQLTSSRFFVQDQSIIMF